MLKLKCMKKISSFLREKEKQFNHSPFVDVYIAQIPNDKELKTVYPPSRQDEILSVSNEKVRREKYFVWKLLEYALDRTFGKKITDINFIKMDCGKWCCDVCEFSISHSHNAVCVAISTSPVGVDIEKIQTPKVDVSRKILSPTQLVEYASYNADDKVKFLINAWTKKESLFKKQNARLLTREQNNTQEDYVFQKTVFVANEPYSLSVATDISDNIKIYEKIDFNTIN